MLSMRRRTRPPGTARPVLEPFLPLLDPDHFDDVDFHRGLAEIGYRQVLIGGTGSAKLRAVVEAVRRETSLEVVLFPAGPDSVCAADLIVLPDIMNSRAQHARPFGPTAVMAAAAASRTGSPCLPVAHFIMGESTARWYFDAEPIAQPKILAATCHYAQMVGYRYIALDYEGAGRSFDPAWAGRIKASAPRCRLTVSDERGPEEAAGLRDAGVDTVVLPSNVLEEEADPLALAAEYHRRLLAPRASAWPARLWGGSRAPRAPCP